MIATMDEPRSSLHTRPTLHLWDFPIMVWRAVWM